VTRARAAALAALLAVAVYLPSLGNRFAMDDGAIVERNPAAHDVAAAVRAAAGPYWPAEHAAGLWRPAVILSFAADWQVFHGDAWWLHAENVLWHALATALLVALLWPLATPGGALAAGLLFAVHPVHVEAVAGLVGRAELMAAVFLFAALLIARTVRQRRADGLTTWADEVLLLAAVALALLCKEHAAVAIGLLALDEWLDAGRPARLPIRDYVLVACLTIAWFVVRRQVEGGRSFTEIAPAFFHLGTAARLATMLPVVLVVVRLFLWPFDLSAYYQPRVVERLTHLTFAGVVGLAVVLAAAWLAFRLRRRDRLVAAGLLVIGIAWLPTANLLFPTGIVIAERTLYLASAGLAFVVAALWDRVAARAGSRGAAAGLVVVLIAFSVRSATREVVWRDNRSLVVASLLAHPESYKAHEVAARAYLRLGDARTALREYGAAVRLYPLDPYLLTEQGFMQLNGGLLPQALLSLRAAEQLDATHALPHQLLANVLLLMDSSTAALVEARRAVAADPTLPGAARMLAASWLRLGQPDSALAVWPAFARSGGPRFERWLLACTTLAALHRDSEARRAFDSAVVDIPQDSLAMQQLSQARQILRGGGLR